MRRAIRRRLESVIAREERVTIEEIGRMIEEVAGRIGIYGFRSNRGYLITIETPEERCELVLEGRERYRILRIQA